MCVRSHGECASQGRNSHTKSGGTVVAPFPRLYAKEKASRTNIHCSLLPDWGQEMTSCFKSLLP